MKEYFKTLLIKVRAWLLALASNLWEYYLKDTLKAQIDELVHKGINKVNAYYKSEEYDKKKEEILTFIFDNIKLPFMLKPFKGLIRSILVNSIEKQIEKALEKLNKFEK